MLLCVRAMVSLGSSYLLDIVKEIRLALITLSVCGGIPVPRDKGDILGSLELPLGILEHAALDRHRQRVERGEGADSVGLLPLLLPSLPMLRVKEG